MYVTKQYDKIGPDETPCVCEAKAASAGLLAECLGLVWVSGRLILPTEFVSVPNSFLHVGSRTL